ncbi:MAG TPA: LacI family DNA-binding transcriptional regulator [Solirubrobacteraceae bacterium]|nr:LacI family DNA-binding transcriptional regulator [Solirubrobacteraceae bacterium]
METLADDNGRSSRLTIREVADLAGVSTATVSRVINGRAEVSEKARKAVMRVVREHGYSTNRTARALSGGRTGLVGVMSPVVHHSYFSVILDGAGEALYEHDMRMVLCPTHHEHEREVTLLERLMHGTTDGAVLILPEESGEELSALHDHGYRFVIIDPHKSSDERVPTVSASHTSGASDAVEHLLGLGHRRIAAVTGPRGWIATEERLRGYRAALAAAGVMPDPRLEMESDFSDRGGVQATEALLDLPDPPTAIFAFNDMLAIGAMQAARARGIRIPEDLSVVGFDDTFEASIVTPTLTTVRQPLAEMGRMAVALLVRLLQNQRIEALHVELATKLVVRESTAAVAVPVAG